MGQSKTGVARIRTGENREGSGLTETFKVFCLKIFSMHYFQAFQMLMKDLFEGKNDEICVITRIDDWKIGNISLTFVANQRTHNLSEKVIIKIFGIF